MKIYRIAKINKVNKINEINDERNIVLPGQDFFKPTADFLVFLKQAVGSKIVVECGAGNGLFTKKMREKGINVFPIDLFERDSDFLAIKQDATTFEYPKNSIAIIARPSRGDWIHGTILQAINSASFILYIGIAAHLDEDINELVNLYPGKIQVSQIYKDAGQEGEVVFKISKTQGENMNSSGTKYFLVKYRAAVSLFFTSWFEDEGNKWRNFAGGFTPKSSQDVILEEQFVSDIHELDWKKTSMYKPDSEAGWLGRDGAFIGCSYQEHDLVADLILNKSVAELEKEGWVRIYNKNTWDMSSIARLSPAQRNYLSLHGHQVLDNN